MSSILKWKTVTLRAGAGPATITIRGNVDTRVATRYFWLPVTDTQAEATWDRKDDEPLSFDLALVGNGQNHLGFVCQVAPVVRSQPSLRVTLEVRQGDTILLTQDYPLTAPDPNTAVTLVDGITVAVL